MNIKPFHYIHPDFSKIKDQDAFFDQMSNAYPELYHNGMFLAEKNGALIGYRIKTKNRIYKGILASVDIHNYLRGLIRKHENTLTLHEANISKLMIERNALIKPILIAYNQQKKIKDLLEKCFTSSEPKFKIQITKDNQTHEFYEITDKKTITQFQKEFKSKVKKAYIADGHHRMASVCKMILQNPELSLKKLNYIYCALFDFSELSILPYNRIIRTFDSIEPTLFFKLLSKYSNITQLKKPRTSHYKHELIVLTAEAAYALEWKKEVMQYFKQKNGIAFDMDIFNEIILRDIIGIQSIRTSDRIGHLGGIKKISVIDKMVKEDNNLIGFIFFPVRKNEFTDVADEHMVLPPKSTWFEPRLKNGIIVQDLQLEFQKLNR